MRIDCRSEVTQQSDHALAREIGAIWCDVLGLNSVDLDDNFFELGGHSILVAEVVAKMRTALEVSVPLWIMVETHSLGELVERVGRALEGNRGTEAVRPSRVRTSNAPLGLSGCQCSGSPSKLSKPCRRASGCFRSFDQDKIEPPSCTPNSK